MEVAVLGVLATAVLLSAVVRWYATLPRPGSDYVYVEDDGSVRDLDPDEVEYLETDFLPNDGGRPYIKGRYRDKTPDGRLGGYLPRRKVPRRLRTSP